MGCFDSVIAACPECQTELEFQTKAGPCMLRRYPPGKVPARIAAGADGDEQRCPNCGTLVGLRLPLEYRRLKLVVIRVPHDDPEDD